MRFFLTHMEIMLLLIRPGPIPRPLFGPCLAGGRVPGVGAFGIWPAVMVAVVLSLAKPPTITWSPTTSLLTSAFSPLMMTLVLSVVTFTV